MEVLELVVGVLEFLEHHSSFLVFASRNGHLQIVELLLIQKFDFCSREDAALAAASNSHATIFHLVLKDAESLPTPRSLLYACTHALKEIARQLLDMNDFSLEELIQGIYSASPDIVETFFCYRYIQSLATISRAHGSDE